MHRIILTTVSGYSKVAPKFTQPEDGRWMTAEILIFLLASRFKLYKKLFFRCYTSEDSKTFLVWNHRPEQSRLVKMSIYNVM